MKRHCQKVRRFTEWEKISANHVSDKGLNIQNIERAPATQQQKSPEQPHLKMGKGLKHFSKEGT